MAISLAALSLLEDVVVSTAFGAAAEGDTGVPVSSWATPTTINVDKISATDEAVLVDHGGGQSVNEFMRGTKKKAGISIEMKLFSGLPAYAPLQQIKVIVTGTLAGNTVSDTFSGIVAKVARDYGGPSDLKIDIAPYGTALARV